MRPSCLSRRAQEHTSEITWCDVSYYDYCQIQNGFWSLLWHYLLNSSPISPNMHILSPFLHFHSFLARYLSGNTFSCTLPYCLYLCSTISLLFPAIARALAPCLSTLYVHCKFICVRVWFKAILYSLPTFFSSRYLI